MWFFTTLIAKIASAGVAAQAATGAGIVLVGVTGLGAAGALPDPVQHTFSTVVSAINPADAAATPTDPAPSGDPAASTDPASLPTGPALPTATDSTESPVVGDPTTTESQNPAQQVGEGTQGENAQGDDAQGDDAQGDDTETDAPDVQAPETDAPETDAPETQAPETEAPHTDATDGNGESSNSGEQGDTGGHSQD